MTDQATAAAIEPRPRYDQQVSVLVDADTKDFLRGAVDLGPEGLKEADVVRRLLDAGIDAMIKDRRNGQAWYDATLAHGRTLPIVTREPRPRER
jgi:hypothetical protein